METSDYEEKRKALLLGPHSIFGPKRTDERSVAAEHVVSHARHHQSLVLTATVLVELGRPEVVLRGSKDELPLRLHITVPLQYLFHFLRKQDGAISQR